MALVLALVATGLLAVWHRRRDGRLRQTRAVAAALDPTSPASQQDLRPLVPGQTGERATLLQFSSAFCAPCRATRSTLSDVAKAVPGVAHVEVDAESHLDLVRRLRVLKTPTTLVLDAHGREVLRASGQPRKEAVLQALAQAVLS